MHANLRTTKSGDQMSNGYEALCNASLDARLPTFSVVLPREDSNRAVSHDVIHIMLSSQSEGLVTLFVTFVT